MIPVNHRIVVRVDLAQKNRMKIGDTVVHTANNFDTNYRERSPVIAEVVDGNEYIRKGMLLCCHHNHFYDPSPYHLQDDLYSIPINRTIFGYFDKKGNLKPLCGNIIGEQVDIPTAIPLPPELIKQYKDRVIVTNGKGTPYKKGDLAFTRPSAPYIIVFHWNDIQKRVTKVDSEMIIGIVKAK